MIVQENITINEREFVRTFSDADMLIERGGVRYSEAVDLPGNGFVYTETDEPVPDNDIDPAEAISRLEAIF